MTPQTERKRLAQRRCFIQQYSLDGYKGRADVKLEFKRFMMLKAKFPGRSLPMLSKAVDAVWHQLILDTRAYAEFCQGAAGQFIHHKPAGKQPPDQPSMSYVEFAQLYRDEFGQEPPEAIWRETERRPAVRWRRIKIIDNGPAPGCD